MNANKQTTITKTYQDIEVHFSAEDGWVNATKLAKAFNRPLHHFWQIPHMEKARLDKTRTETSYKGTWMHPTLAHTFASWLSKDLATWLAVNLPRPAPTSDTYVTLNTFNELTGLNIGQPTSNHLTDKAKELTLKEGLEVRKIKEVRTSKEGKAYKAKNNGYPLKFWHEALELLKKQKKTKKDAAPVASGVVKGYRVVRESYPEDCPF